MKEKKTQEIYSNDIELAIETEGANIGFDNLTLVSQGQFKAVCYRVGQTMFKDNSIFKSNELVDNGSCMDSTLGAYDVDKLYSLIPFVEYIAIKYNKLIDLDVFCKLFNINYFTIDAWKYCKETNPKRFDFHKTMMRLQERSMLDRAGDSRNILGLFQVGRRLFNWDMPNVRNSDDNKHALSANELPQLTASNNDFKQIAQDD